MIDLIDQGLKEEFYREFKDLSLGIEEYLLKLEKDTENGSFIREIFRPFHTIKGNSALIGETQIQEISQLSESLLDEIRQGRQKLNQEIIDLCFMSIDFIKETSSAQKPTNHEIRYRKIKESLEKALEGFSQSNSYLENKQRETLRDERIDNRDYENTILIVKTLNIIENCLTQMKVRRELSHFLPEAFDLISDLFYKLIIKKKHIVSKSLLDYLDIYIRALYIDTQSIYTDEKWALLNKMFDDLLYLLFPFIIEKLRIKIMYFNMGDDITNLTNDINEIQSVELTYILINLNIGLSPDKQELRDLIKLWKRFGNKLIFIQRFLDMDSLLKNEGFQLDEIPLIEKNFWSALFKIANKL